MAENKTFEYARETVKQLTLRKLPPTPANYQKVYEEISGAPRLLPFPETQLQTIVAAMPTKTPGQQKLHGQLESAVRNHNWTALQNALISFAQNQPVNRPSADGILAPGQTAPVLTHHSAPSSEGPPSPELREQIARLVEFALPAVGVEDQQLLEQTQQLKTQLRQPVADAATLRLMLSNFNHRLGFEAEEQAAIKTALLELLQTVIRNIAELSVDDRWLKGQLEALTVATQPPLTLRRLEDLRARLKDVVFKQGEAKAQMMEAQEAIKRELSTFMERLAGMSESTSVFSGRIESSARKLETAQRIEDIAPVLQEVIATARTMALDTQRASEELRQLREKTQAAEARAQQLQAELERASEQARHDPLTGTLNRKGLDEAVQREISGARRKGSNLCLALLDIDNFKKLNDTHGHDAGDAALVHLTKITRECIRPQDTLARYGGEEFIILLPDASVDQAVEAMTRVQRELTKHYFLAGSEHLLITFSAGVTALNVDETAEQAITRADQAMYLAKRTGKNRVVAS